MIWFLIIGIVLFILYRFFASLNEDKRELQIENLSEKFNIIVYALNDAAFNGMGSITIVDKRAFNIYREPSNQIITFQYSTGHLTITWRYKYLQKEVKHERQFNDVRNLSLFEQQRIADTMISDMGQVVERHKNSVLGM